MGTEIRQALASGTDLVVGTMLEGPGNPSQWRAYLATGIDFVFIDNEHQPLGPETTAGACHYFASCGCAPLVRVASADGTLVSRAIDGGAMGVIAPYVESAESVWKVVAAAKYRPLKGQALQGLRDGGRMPSEATLRYLRGLNEQRLAVVMIESARGIDSVREIVAFEELDAVLIGPNDLSINLGVPNDYDGPLFREAVAEVLRVSREAGKGFGLHLDELDQSSPWVERGANFMVYSRDTFGACRYIRQGVEALRAARGGSRVRA